MALKYDLKNAEQIIELNKEFERLFVEKIQASDTAEKIEIEDELNKVTFIIAVRAFELARAYVSIADDLGKAVAKLSEIDQ